MTTAKTPPPATVERFRAWTDERGVVASAAAFGCSKSHLSHIRAGEVAPSLELAAKIETATAGFIRCSDWTRRG